MKRTIEKEIGRQPNFLDWIRCTLFKVSVQSIILYKLSRTLRKYKYLKPICVVIDYLRVVLSGCYISSYCTIGNGIYLPHPTGIVIGNDVVIGNDCTIYQHVTIGRRNSDESEYPIIGDGVTIYAGACIVGNISIGSYAIIGANAVVTKDIPKGACVAGVPAKVISINESI